jgi:prepilin-type N-terminal cleavage/methylation domain-containing protein
MVKKHAGFSLLEMMIVMVLVMIISGVILQTINVVGSRAATEQSKTDVFQEAREFMDQMSRDLRQAGYPSTRNMDPSIFDQTLPYINDARGAAGLVSVSATDLQFEGDTDGTGEVKVIHYHLDTSTANGCPCLKRSELPKVDGDPLTEQTAEVYQVEVQGVKNTTVFSVYTNGDAISLPVDITTSGGNTIAQADTVQAMLTLESATIDPQTRQKSVTTLISTVRLNNCSQAAIGFKTSCQ